MLYNENQDIDILNILEHLEAYGTALGLEEIPINSQKLLAVCRCIREDFPCVNGLEKSSIFKRAAVFVACFVEISPIEDDAFKDTDLNENLRSKNANAIIALDIAFKFMSLAKVTRSDDKIFFINNGITLSFHSYFDFLDMLSKDITLKDHFMVLSLLFEQVIYKTHPDMQYDVVDLSEEVEVVEEISQSKPKYNCPVHSVTHGFDNPWEITDLWNDTDNLQ